MAKKKESEILYSIGQNPILGKPIETKKGIAYPRSKYSENFSQYDLVNWATTNFDGNIRQGSHEFYDTKFKEKLNGIAISKVALCLDHHFEKSNNKTALIERIEKYILIDFLTSMSDVRLKDDRMMIVSEWIREKKKELPKEKKADNKKQKTLSDYFTHTEMKFSDLQNVIELAGLSNKGVIKERGISYKAKAVYEVLAKDRNVLEDTREEFVEFRDAFTMHFCNLKLSSSSYSNRDNKGNVERHKKSLKEVFNKRV